MESPLFTSKGPPLGFNSFHSVFLLDGFLRLAKPYFI